MKKSNWKTNKGKFKGEIGVWEGENRRPSPQERNTFSNEPQPERAILVAVCDSRTTMERAEESLAELAFLHRRRCGRQECHTEARAARQPHLYR